MSNEIIASINGEDILGDVKWKQVLRKLRNTIGLEINDVQKETRVYCEVSDETIITPEYKVGEINPDAVDDIFFDVTRKALDNMSFGDVNALCHWETGPLKNYKFNYPLTNGQIAMEDMLCTISVELGVILQGKALDILNTEFNGALEFPNENNDKDTRQKGNLLENDNPAIRNIYNER